MTTPGRDRISDRVWVPVAMGAAFFAWLALFALGLTTRAVETVRPLLPPWFQTVNLLAALVLVFLTAASLPIRPVARLLCGVLALCSVSAMYLAYALHPVAYMITLAVLFTEAFVAVPLWNRHRHRRLGRAETLQPGNRRNSRAFDLVVYLVIGLSVAACLVYAVISKH